MKAILGLLVSIVGVVRRITNVTIIGSIIKCEDRPIVH